MQQYIFENVRIFDGVSPDLTDPVSVLIEGDVITEISTRRSGTASAVRIDCKGNTLMPGLIDCHVHVYGHSINQMLPEPPATYRAHYAQKFLRYALSNGFTSVRDVAGGDHGTAMALRDGLFEGPRFFYGGLCLSQTGGHGDVRPSSQPTSYGSCGAEHNSLAVIADGVDECRKAVREELRKGASHIKIMASGGILSATGSFDRSQYSEAEIRAIVEECVRHGAYVCAHCHPAEAARRCVEYGVRCIEHGTMIDEDTASYVASKGAYVVPTMAIIFALSEDGAQLGMDAIGLERARKAHEHALRGLEIMKRAGVKIGFGTDLLGTQHVRHGDEFTIRGQALTPFDVLHSATAVNAEILQMQGKLGVIRPGAFADMLVIDGNPLSNIDLLARGGKSLRYILARGRFVKGAGE